MTFGTNNGLENPLRPCPISGADGDSLRSLGPVAISQPGDFSCNNFSLVYCEYSDLVYLNPLPQAKDFDVMYSAGQFDSDEYVDPQRIESMMQYYGGCIKQHFNLQQTGPFRLLEVGAGMAWVSRALKGIRADSVTRAQDISRECKDVCAWVDDYFVGPVEEFSGQIQERFHAISLTHVIEHLPDPVGTLKTLSEMLEPGGLIFVTAPRCPKGWSPEQGLGPWLDYAYLHVPAHITYFSETSVQMAAQKAGLRLTFWDGSHDDGQAFEAILSQANSKSEYFIVAGQNSNTRLFAGRNGIHKGSGPTMTDPDWQLRSQINSNVLNRIDQFAAEFAGAEPFRYVVIDNFLSDDFCAQLIDEFPDFDEKLALNEDGLVGAKAVREKIRGIGPAFRSLDELTKSRTFRDLIGKITAIPELQHDPHYFGGGTHENRHGQGLDPHVDFNYHPITRQHRRLNLIVYLNPEWDTEWGGALRLHRDPYLTPSKDDIKQVDPLANRCVIFETTENSWHGFKRIDLPEDKRHLSRKSFAIYYYTENRPLDQTAPEHSTIYVQEHLPEWYHEGMTLDGEELQRIRIAVASRNQHLKRLYRNIMDLNLQIHDLRHQLATEEAAVPIPETTPAGGQPQNPGSEDEQAVYIRRLSVQLRKSQMRVKELEESTSWRITAPMRALKKAFSRN